MSCFLCDFSACSVVAVPSAGKVSLCQRSRQSCLARVICTVWCQTDFPEHLEICFRLLITAIRTMNVNQNVSRNDCGKYVTLPITLQKALRQCMYKQLQAALIYVLAANISLCASMSYKVLLCAVSACSIGLKGQVREICHFSPWAQLRGIQLSWVLTA